MGSIRQLSVESGAGGPPKFGNSLILRHPTGVGLLGYCAGRVWAKGNGL